MLLKRIELTDFLSIKGKLPVEFDKKVTVLLGSNDHGKSNILAALQHLNDDTPITEDEVNWDASGAPTIAFSFEMTAGETKTWRAIVEKLSLEIKERAAKALEPEEAKTPQETATPPKPPTPNKPSVVEDDRVTPEELPPALLNPATSSITLTRVDVDGELQVEGIDVSMLPEEMQSFIENTKPRVELFKTITTALQDAATAADIISESFEFLQGVFFYAGLDPRDCSKVFTRNDRTMRQLQNASAKLDTNLRQLWGQGTDLHFYLSHKGSEKANAIEFLANDPSIESQVARMSKRSAGFTQFFTVSMILNARRNKFPANSYIYLFDEPGVYLHPQGQRDLLQVFEKLADENQIVYATHSLFLLNQNFPERHRLVYKDKDGTKIDHKPYQQNWKRATDALGVYLTSNILFSNKILLVEGDSDPLYIYELFRQLTKAVEVDADLNLLGIMSFSNYQNLRFLLQLFKKEASDTSVLVLVDGDAAGRTIAKQISELCKRLNVQSLGLNDGHSIEDLCLYEEQFLAAVGTTIRNACEVEEKAIPDGLDDLVRKSWDSHKTGKPRPEKKDKSEKNDDAKETKETKKEKLTTGKWFKEVTRELIADEASKVVLARTYVELCRDARDLKVRTDRMKVAKGLCQEIAKKLEIPEVRAQAVVESSPEKGT